MEVSGRLVTPSDVGQLADAIIQLARDRDKRQTFGKAGLEFVRKQFDPERLTDRVEAILKNVASSRS